MSYSVEKLPDERIVIAHANNLYSAADDGVPLMQNMIDVLDEQETPVYLIVDIAGLDMSLDELLQSSAAATRESQFFKHPKIIETIAVTDSSFLRLALQGLNTPAFGNVNISVCEQLEEALVAARERIAAAG